MRNVATGPRVAPAGVDVAANDPAPLAQPASVSRAPRIRLPILGGANLQVELTGLDYSLAAIVTGDVRRHRGQVSELFLMRGPLHIEDGPQSLWIHVGSAAFRTDPTQMPSLQDFIDETERYALLRKYSDPAGSGNERGA